MWAARDVGVGTTNVAGATRSPPIPSPRAYLLPGPRAGCGEEVWGCGRNEMATSFGASKLAVGFDDVRSCAYLPWKVVSALAYACTTPLRWATTVDIVKVLLAARADDE